MEEIARHNTKDAGIWVTFKDGVYDVTEFVENHPGGDKLLLAAGSSIEPFWAMYNVHNTEEVHTILETLRIGNLAEKDRSQRKEKVMENPFANEPARLPLLKVNSAQPFNAEPPLEVLADSYITPTSLFYVRNHLPVPVVDPAKYRLEIEGEGTKTVSLSLEDLKSKFRKHYVTTTIQCAGNRRAELSTVKKVKGLNWEGGAIGNATFGGVYLRDVLKEAGLDLDHPTVRHIQFEGLDQDVVGQTYGASIPIDFVMNPQRQVLLAYEMNGEPLTPDHGYPLRVVIPGVVGARNVKWLGKVVASKEESKSFWQRRDYKSFSPSVDFSDVDWDSSPAIQELPVQSLICEPKADAVIEGDTVDVRGYAYSGGGRRIVRVDVSYDGKTWFTADLSPEAVQQPDYQAWAWTPFSATLEIPKELRQKGKIELCCKAVDIAYNTQPEQPDAIWNMRGLLSNAWHRVPITIEDVEDDE